MKHEHHSFHILLLSLSLLFSFPFADANTQNQQLKRERFIWLMVLELSVSGCLAPRQGHYNRRAGWRKLLTSWQLRNRAQTISVKGKEPGINPSVMTLVTHPVALRSAFYSFPQWLSSQSSWQSSLTSQLGLRAHILFVSLWQLFYTFLALVICHFFQNMKSFCPVNQRYGFIFWE